MNLPATQVRILGALLEKEATTPDVYPLSLNSLTVACNQLSNREPVMQLSETDVRNAVNALRQESLVRAIQPAGSKVMKFQHLLTEKLNLEPRDRAVLCVLMLRGPQTLGEIRTRTARLAEFGSVEDVEATLRDLAGRQLAIEMERRPGQKETRFMHLLGGTPADDALPGVAAETQLPPDSSDEVKQSIDQLRRELAELRAQFEDFRRQFG